MTGTYIKEEFSGWYPRVGDGPPIHAAESSTIQALDRSSLIYCFLRVNHLILIAPPSLTTLPTSSTASPGSPFRWFTLATPLSTANTGCVLAREDVDRDIVKQGVIYKYFFEDPN